MLLRNVTHPDHGVTDVRLEADRITSELSKAEEDGRLARFNGHVQDQLVSAYTRQPALALARVTRPSSRLFDPSLTVMRDIRDHRGILIAAAGTRINPLDRLPLPATLIFIDGRDPDQLAFALGYPGHKKIILTGGNPQRLMQMHDHQLFYDQKGVLSEKFQLKAVPHDWLFPQVAAVVHHGGAGTTAAGLRAGRPTVICPFFGDQPFWGRRVHELGVGVEVRHALAGVGQNLRDHYAVRMVARVNTPSVRPVPRSSWVWWCCAYTPSRFLALNSWWMSPRNLWSV